MLAVLIVFIILGIIAFFFGGNIILGLIFILPIMVAYLLGTSLNLPNFAKDFIALLFYIIAFGMFFYFGNVNRKEYDKAIREFELKIQNMTDDQKSILKVQTKQTILNWEKSRDDMLSVSQKAYVGKENLQIKIYRKYLELLNEK